MSGLGPDRSAESAEPASQRMEVDVLVRHGRIVTVDEAMTEYADGGVAIDRGRILGVDRDAAIAARFIGRTSIDAAGGIVHPGLIESHVHASYHLIRGLIPEDHDPVRIFDDYERPFYDSVTDDDEYLSVTLAGLEMLRNGTTCFLEAGTVLEPDAAERAVNDVGIRAVLADPRIVDPEAEAPRAMADRRIARGPKTRAEAFARLGIEASRTRDPDSLVTGHIAVHGLGTSSLELLRAARRRAQETGTVLNMHYAYAREDAQALAERLGPDPLVRLAEEGILGPDVTLAHANFLTERETDVLVDHDATVAWAPAASMVWGVGGAIEGRHSRLWRHGLTVGLASDSANWSNDFDLFRQMDLALLVSREINHDHRSLAARDVLRMATRGGARASGKQDELGSLAPGFRADLVIHTTDRPEAHPQHDPIVGLVLAGRSKTVRTVLVAGEVVIRDGQPTRIDQADLLREVDRAATSLVGRMSA